MSKMTEDLEYQEEQMPKRRLRGVARALILMMVLALVGGSVAGMWAGMADYFRYGRVGWDGLANLGDEALMTGDYEKALVHYRQAIDLEPHHPGNASLYAGMGTAYYYSGEMQAALSSFQRALQLDPDHWGALYSSGIIYHYVFMDYRQAAGIWESMLEMSWNDPEIEEYIEDLLADANEKLTEVR